MRTDDSLNRRSFRSAGEWKRDPATGTPDPTIDSRLDAGDVMVDGQLKVHSLSGHERNHFFINHDHGRAFANLSAVSGLDDPADSRGFALLDYDRDGWQDIALVNAGNPLTRLYHNDIGELTPGAGMVAVRFVGGNRSLKPSEMSCRDGYGARAEVTVGRHTMVREHRCGDGYAAQNSATMLVGIGGAEAADKITVRWPSGRQFTLTDVPEGTLVTAYENRKDGPFTTEPYRTKAPPAPAPEDTPPHLFPLAAQVGPADAGTRIRVFTTTATWCAACVAKLPDLAPLAAAPDVELLGVPIDPDDDAAKLAAYVGQRNPPYRMLDPLDARDHDALASFLRKALDTPTPPLPSTVVTDAQGAVLTVTTGVPTLSDLRKLRTQTTERGVETTQMRPGPR